MTKPTKEEAKRSADFRKWKEKAGLSFEDMAHKTGLHQNTLQAWASRGKKPRDIFRQKIAETFPNCPLGA